MLDRAYFNLLLTATVKADQKNWRPGIHGILSRTCLASFFLSGNILVFNQFHRLEVDS